MFRFLFVLIYLLCVSAALHAQASLQGVIHDDMDEPLAYSTIALLDSTQHLVKGSVSDEFGHFSFTGLSPGVYALSISYIGYSPFSPDPVTLTKNQALDLGTVTFRSSAIDLKEVEVTTKRALIEVYADKMVFNVDGSANASGNNGLELLGKAPGVAIDPDGNIIVLGKGGVRVYINGRPSNLSGTDLTSMLQSMQSDNILSIEIITNPSAKYEAEGNAGIINIVLKKNVNLGLNGSYIGSYSRGDLRRYSNSLSMNYRNGPVNAYGTISQTDNHFQEDFIDTKLLSNGLFLDQRTLGVNRRASYAMAGGIDVLVHPKHTVGLTANLLRNVQRNTQDGPTLVFQTNPDTLIETLVSNSEDNILSFNGNYNLNYQATFSDKTILNTDLSLGHFDSEGEVDQPNRYLDPNGQLNREVKNKFNTRTGIRILGAQTDLETELFQIDLLTGVRATQIETENEFKFYQSPNGAYELDILRSNDFSYSEKVLAGYLILKKSLGQHVDVNAGIRVEHTSSVGQLVSQVPTENAYVKRSYTNYFPNVSVSYKPSPGHAVSLSVGRRITRPSYQDLNPFEKKVSEITTFKGNPFLQPQYITNYQLTVDHRLGKERLVATLLFSQNTGYFAKILEIQNERETFIIPRNMEVNNTYSATFNYPVHFTSWWEAVSFASLNYITYKGQFGTADIGINTFVYDARIQNNIQLPAGFFLDVTASYQSPWIWRGTIEIEANSELNMGIRKDFFNKQLQVRLTATDIFNSASDYPYYGNYGGLEIDGEYRSDNSRYGASLTWKFGNQQLKSSKKRKSGLNEELKRISD
ncbi:MAG: TonB-dependent receptor family protein [Saprospiraceae bacterium]|nr:TonB-dependent receptor family protein [Saprospiraceae bacterium]